ncbi:complement component C9 [Nothobranchius furzeri]|uniref:Complement component C9 n=2 Tax=Nothobranchius furzeri TaxID=105023 RepID=A0A8C6LCD1_NOTFU|nr:complement component C9 [Nothobranchius furzeri]KAF7217527.1 complement component 9 [Nothobranchius furzeri]
MMRTDITVQLSICALCLSLTAFDGLLLLQLPDPSPIDCVWSRWSGWTSCDPCTNTRRRSRGIEIFGQFGGEACAGSIGEREFCQTSDLCLQPTPSLCSDSEFQCGTELKTCIKARLECNGDYDCEDGSDEDCDPVRRPCGNLLLENNEQGRTAGYGINILGAAPRMNPFFNDYFNGRCDKVRNPNTGKYDRLPWNIGVLNYETLVEETVSKEIYENTHTLLKEILQESTFSIDAGLSFKLSPSEQSMSNMSVGGEVGAEYSRTNMIKKVEEYTTIKNKSFMKVKGKVQMSTYRMRSRELKVAEEFLLHVKSLPLDYEKGIYFAFLEDYGTHYTKNGKSGGQYELIYVLNQDTIKQKNITERSLQNCVKVGISVNVGVPDAANAEAHVKPKYCDKFNPKDTEISDGKAMVDKVMTSVRGGTLLAASAMKTQLNTEGTMSLKTYQDWAHSITEEPALLYSEPEPIYMLVPLDLPSANTRISNLKRAIEEYVAEYNKCKCKPCQNGGTLALLDGKCICMCPNLFEGQACQNFKSDKAKSPASRPAVIQVGNWSCWSAWSSCSGGKRTRSRRCNMDGLTDASCRGDTTSEGYC